jgi:hypothetical protein
MLVAPCILTTAGIELKPLTVVLFASDFGLSANKPSNSARIVRVSEKETGATD